MRMQKCKKKKCGGTMDLGEAQFLMSLETSSRMRKLRTDDCRRHNRIAKIDRDREPIAATEKKKGHDRHATVLLRVRHTDRNTYRQHPRPTEPAPIRRCSLNLATYTSSWEATILLHLSQRTLCHKPNRVLTCLAIQTEFNEVRVKSKLPCMHCTHYRSQCGLVISAHYDVVQRSE